MSRPTIATTSSRPSETIDPHSGVGGTTPRPRNDRPANTRMALPRSSVISTTSGPTAFGRIWRNRMWVGAKPMVLGRRDVFQRALAEHQAARQAGEFRPPHHQHGDHRVARADAQRRGDRHRQDDRREAEHQVGGAHQDFLGPAARIGGDRADQRADRAADQHHGEADRQRGARAVDDAASTRRGRVRRCRANAPATVGARRPATFTRVGRIGRDPGRQHGGQHPGHDDRAADRRSR